MATAKLPEKTSVYSEETIKRTYRQKGWKGLITWWVKDKDTCIGKDLVIITRENYDRIILNGKVLQAKEKQEMKNIEKILFLGAGIPPVYSLTKWAVKKSKWLFEDDF